MSKTPNTRLPILAENVNSEQPIYSVADVCEVTGLSRNSVYRGIRHGEIPSLKVGARYILPRPMIDAWLRRGSVVATGVS